MNPLKRVGLSASYYPTLGFIATMTAIGRWNWWDWIDEQVAVGARPFRRHLRSLAEQGITGIVNLCEEFRGDPAALADCGMTQLWLPTVDYAQPTEAHVTRGLAFMREYVERGRKVYVHCKAGQGRSATLALCYLMERYRLNAIDACARLRDVRPHVMRNLHRRSVVLAWERRLAVRNGPTAQHVVERV